MDGIYVTAAAAAFADFPLRWLCNVSKQATWWLPQQPVVDVTRAKSQEPRARNGAVAVARQSGRMPMPRCPVAPSGTVTHPGKPHFPSVTLAHRPRCNMQPVWSSAAGKTWAANVTAGSKRFLAGLLRRLRAHLRVEGVVEVGWVGQRDRDVGVVAVEGKEWVREEGMVSWLAYTIRTINIVRQQARCLGWKGGKGGKTGLSEHSKVTLPLCLLHDTQTMGRRNERQTTGCSNCVDLAVAINRTPVSGNVMKSVPAKCHLEGRCSVVSGVKGSRRGALN